MIRIETVRNYYPAHLRDQAVFSKYMLKEYLQLLILDYISTSPYIRKITFIGGTSIRLIKGIDRFSEDLDFDCKDFSLEEFIGLTNGVYPCPISIFFHKGWEYPVLMRSGKQQKRS
jgi:hypothetical protein